MGEHISNWSASISHILLLNVILNAILSSSTIQANDKTVITLKDLTEAITERNCPCTKNGEIFKRSDEYLRMLLRISSIRIVSTLQRLAERAKAEINYLIESSRWQLYEDMSKNFPHLFNQPFVSDYIDAFFGSIRKQLFITGDISTQRIEKEAEKLVEKFFTQLILPTFLCIATGACKSVSQSYANCVHNSSPPWKLFYGTEPSKMSSALRHAILKYRLIENTIDKLHKSALESETINDSCAARNVLVTNCAPVCALKQSLEQHVAFDYCREDCRNAVRACLHDSANDWDDFVSILRKLSTEFDKGFFELGKGIIRSISYAIETHAPVIAKTVLRRCGRISFSKAEGKTRHMEYQKPDIVQRRVVVMIQQIDDTMHWNYQVQCKQGKS